MGSANGLPAGTARESYPLRSGTDGSHVPFRCRADLRRRDMISNQKQEDAIADRYREERFEAHARAKGLEGCAGLALNCLPKIIAPTAANITARRTPRRTQTIYPPIYGSNWFNALQIAAVSGWNRRSSLPLAEPRAAAEGEGGAGTGGGGAQWEEPQSRRPKFGGNICPLSHTRCVASRTKFLMLPFAQLLLLLVVSRYASAGLQVCFGGIRCDALENEATLARFSRQNLK